MSSEFQFILYTYIHGHTSENSKTSIYKIHNNMKLCPWWENLDVTNLSFFHVSYSMYDGYPDVFFVERQRILIFLVKQQWWQILKHWITVKSQSATAISWTRKMPYYKTNLFLKLSWLRLLKIMPFQGNID